MMRYPISSLWATFAVGLVAACVAKAGPIGPPTVTYTVTGSSNDWTLDFTVDNNTNQSLYLFGVLFPATDVTGAPSSDWCTSCNTPWSNAPDGGSSISYNNVWITSSGQIGAIDPGTSLGGFTALDTTDVAAPTSIDWFAFTFEGAEGPYTAGGNFNGAFGGCSANGTPPFSCPATENPGFEGTSAVPEPTSISLFFTGIVGIGLAARWKRSAAA